MPEKTLYIAFYWHMHQPNYRDPFTGELCLPWVRLHGSKDYLDMMLLLEDFPEIHQTFNLVPSLLDQLIAYTDRGAKDRHLELTLKEPSSLTEQERIFILENFFLANWDTMVKPYPRYHELLVKRGMSYSKQDLMRIHRYFTDKDLRDLQVWFNLVWIDPMFINSDPSLKELFKKGSDFTEQDKALVIERQFQILKRIIPTYKGFYQKGQVELSVTPFYHPILPLLWDTNKARIAMPEVVLPKRRFSYPQDAVAQIRKAIEFFKGLFGRPPKGMWPSEGSVCEDVVRAIGEEGIQWIATDEDVLSASLGYGLRDLDGNVTNPVALYRPYSFAGVNLFFRDHRLSDQIGFVYSGWDAQSAVNDFIGRLSYIRDRLPDDRKYVVPVILDGENAWEYYKNDGHDFLRLLYETLSKDKRFKTVTLSEFLSICGGNLDRLSRLHAGSWIYANFGVWIGHEEDNLSWDYLTQTREDLERFVAEHPKVDVSEAWEAIYAAEGSDWNWWYGDDHSTDTAQEFDELYRKHLMKVYEVIGKEIPPHLYVPILMEDRGVLPMKTIKGFIYPKFDGLVTSYYEWLNAGYLDHKQSGGSMHRSEGLITGVYYGFNEESLFLRIDPMRPFNQHNDSLTVEIRIVKPSEIKYSVVIERNSCKASLYVKRDGQWVYTKDISDVAVDEILEIGLGFDELGCGIGEEIQLAIQLIKRGEEVERCPCRGYLSLLRPSPEYEKIMWQ